MSKLPLDLSPTRAFSKIDRTDWTRELWRAAYAQARRQIVTGKRHGAGSRLTWAMDSLHRRFGYQHSRIIRAACWCAFNKVMVTKAATGTAEELARQGMLTRCVRLEPAPRGGWFWAWCHDPLAAANLNRSYRVHLARQRRAVAAAMAEDRHAMEGSRFALTVPGVLALREAEAALATA